VVFLSTLGRPKDRSQTQYEVAYRVGLIARRFQARLTERMVTKGGTEPRWRVLYWLNEEPRGLIQSELAERMGVQGPTLVHILDALEASDLVRRESTKEDRRAKRVMIQAAGVLMLANFDKVAEELRNETFAGIALEDLITTSEVLRRLGITLNGDDASHPGDASKARLAGSRAAKPKTA
jgi:MarR family transcriptional regulator, transcriptional regulator for hemolysin